MILNRYPTFVGYMALLFWALAAPFAVLIKTLPVFEISTIVFAISFFLTATRLTYYRAWYRLKQPYLLWITGFIGIYGNNLLYLLSFRYAPAAHVELINYLWPILVLLFSGLLPNERLTLKHLFAAIFGLAGIYVLTQQAAVFSAQYYWGYLWAFLDAVVWAIYTLISRHYVNSPLEMIGIYSGFAAFCSFAMHINYEIYQAPSTSQLVILIFMGVTTQNLAYLFWEFGIKRGNFKLLSILSYANPILSLTLLIACKMASFSLHLVLASAFILLGCAVGVAPWQQLRARFDKLMQVSPK